MDKLKVGIFGVGHGHANAVAETVKRRSDVEIVGVYESNDALFAKRNDEAHGLYDDIKRRGFDELSSMGLDAALVECSVPRLVELATALAEKGINIHMDKPAGGLDEYKKLLSALKERNLVFRTGYMYRYNAGVRYLIKAVNEGRLGRIYNVSAQMCTKHPKYFKEQLRSYGVKAPVMYIFGCHLIDLVLRIKGKPGYLKSFHTISGDEGLDLEDTSIAVFGYNDGLATIKVSSVETNGWGMRELTVCGERGTICLRPIESPLTLTETIIDEQKPWKDVHRVVPMTEIGRYDLMFDEFFAMIRKEIPYDVDFEHEFDLQKYTLASCGYNVLD
ncbi:MAG: Gfo/Idh/MocA family oxidoreductase [Clostridia bacterium]|nr:Gfo/Idh/MocA family oxidoreductase [Clostridia bacterium]